MVIHEGGTHLERVKHGRTIDLGEQVFGEIGDAVGGEGRLRCVAVVGEHFISFGDDVPDDRGFERE